MHKGDAVALSFGMHRDRLVAKIAAEDPSYFRFMMEKVRGAVRALA